ncbi:MAG TPA: threonine synthase [Candidatus Angelobacter sp.]|nr:threonine synthase [Candidatus Angelobacter sp.]
MMMKTTTAENPTATHILRCVHCGVTQATADRMFRCHECGELLEVVYPESAGAAREFGLRLKEIWRERKSGTLPEDASGVWRFRELLPQIERRHVVTMREGNTPLVELTRSARALNLPQLFAKHQGMNPTGSFKDTGISVAISMARAQGFEFVCCASTGNTSASVAAYAARAEMKSIVLLPAGQVASGKLAQAIEYGAHVLQLQTDFDGCLKVLQDVVQRFPAYLLNSMNPYRLEGQKTVAFEIMEQLDWRVPDHVVVPGGNLANSSALGKGFLELRELGLISTLPKISIIQAAGANPLVRTMRENGGRELVRVNAETRATAIRIGNPASWRKAVGVLKTTGGACEDVTEQEIAQAKAELGAEGVGCEPASAASLAGLKKLVRSGFVKAEETVVLVLTGHMLKDVDYMLDMRIKRVLGPMPADSAMVIQTLERLNAGS